HSPKTEPVFRCARLGAASAAKLVKVPVEGMTAIAGVRHTEGLLASRLKPLLRACAPAPPRYRPTVPPRRMVATATGILMQNRPHTLLPARTCSPPCLNTARTPPPPAATWPAPAPCGVPPA